MATSRFKSVTVQPSQGGNLITSLSAQIPGIGNYTRKRDVRRNKDREMRREGFDYFVANLNLPAPPQAFPGMVDVVSLVRSGTTVTVTTSEPSYYEDGETIIIAGATPSAYNGQWVIENVGSENNTFEFQITGTPGAASGSITATPKEKITMVHNARRPNGETALIVASPRRIYKYVSLANGGYAAGQGTPDEYWYSSTVFDPAAPYGLAEEGQWQTIGHGFAEVALRWQHLNINGYSVFNNGVDLPVTYRVEEDFAVPIYELREQGIAAVGRIAEHNGILMCADITEIQADELEELFDFTGAIPSGNLLALVTGNTLTVDIDFFEAFMVNYAIVFSDGTVRNVIAFPDAKTATLDGDPLTIDAPGQSFTLRPRAQQTGSTYSGLITGTLPSAGPAVVTASGAFFNVGMIGSDLRFTNGFQATIIGYTSPTQVTVNSSPSPDVTAQPFWIINPSTAYIVDATSSFTPDMVGLNIVWDTGEIRKITAFIDGSHVEVNEDMTVPLGMFGIENRETYARYTQTQFTNRIQYKIIWSMIAEPRRFAALIPASVTAGSTEVRLNYPVKSLEFGEEILILGAGQNGGNLLAEILYVGNLGQILQISTPALTTTTDAIVERADAVGSIVGSQELQDDSSAILNMLTLDTTLVIYKATSIFTAQFTGIALQPFNFRIVKDVPVSDCLYYANTLVLVRGRHLYAASNGFFEFDLGGRLPQESALFELCDNVMFEEIELSDTNDVFAATNAITNEVFFSFPSQSGDNALCYDYKQGTVATTSMEITAGGTVNRPAVGIVIGTTENWFVMGTEEGVLVIYGAATQPQNIWGGASSIFYRRFANPYDTAKVGYNSLLWSGYGDFGDQFNEKDINAHVTILSSQSPNTTLDVAIYGTRNPSEPATALANRAFDAPTARNLFPIFFRQDYFQSRLTVVGFDNPIEFSAQIWSVAPINSQSTIRHT